MSEEYEFTLFVAGTGELSTRAKANFDRVIRSRLGDRCTLRVVDILDDPEAAAANRVIAVPLLVRTRPSPAVKLLGDLSAGDDALAHFGIGHPQHQEGDT